MEYRKNIQIKKFCFYGFFKNLKFFEPYLLIYFLNSGLDFLKIGVLFSIKELIIYIFEIPSGVIADYYGKKNELKMCFVMYIISFLLFFIDQHYYVMVLAMIFFGLGEAFRSGTHKAMIYQYLEDNNIFHLKKEIYGYTRSYSKIGSTLSSFISIIFILNFKYYKTIFIVSILPYLADYILINSYPEKFNTSIKNKISIKSIFILIKKQLKSISLNKELNLYVFNSSFYNTIYSIVKDYIQPIIGMILLTNYTVSFLDSDQILKISLGVLYGFFSIGSVITSRHGYRLNKYFSSKEIMKVSYLFFAMGLIAISLSIKFKLTVILVIIFFFIFISKDLRKINFVEIAGNSMKKSERATVMSYNSQLKSIMAIVISPIIGFLADKFLVENMFLIVGIILISSYTYLSYKKRY